MFRAIREWVKRDRRFREADRRGWAAFGAVIRHSLARNQPAAETAIRRANRYYALTRYGSPWVFWRRFRHG